MLPDFPDFRDKRWCGAVMGDDHVAARACSRSFSTLSICIEREGRPEQTGLQTWKGSMTS